MSKKLIILLSFFLLVLSIIFSTRADFSRVEVSFFRLLLPVLKSSRWLGGRVVAPTENLLLSLQKSSTLKLYRQENAQLRSQLAQMKELKKENEFLREEYNVKSNKKEKKVLADVIGFFSDFKGEVFMVNVGSNQGVKRGQSVILPGGILVGKIFSVYDQFSKVAPINHKAVSVAVKTQQTQAKGILEGRGKDKLPVFNLISFDKNVKKETVLTSGLDQIFPPELVVGKIQEVEFIPQESSKKAYVKPLFKFSDLDEVLVVTGQPVLNQLKDSE